MSNIHSQDEERFSHPARSIIAPYTKWKQLLFKAVKTRLGVLKARMPPTKKMLLLVACLMIGVMIVFVIIHFALIDSEFRLYIIDPLLVLCAFSIIVWFTAKMMNYFKDDRNDRER